MKLKQTPADFVVEEMTDVIPSSGSFALYQLQKSGWTTNDAVAEFCRAWKIDRRRMSFGGLKDRHAKSVQHLTILNGPKKNWHFHQLDATYIGQLDHPFLSEHITANRFRITLRDLSRSDIEFAMQQAVQVPATGLPNYFDDQRFGSVTTLEYPARLMVLGRYEDALKLALTAPYEFDKVPAKRKKQLIHQNWGQWRNCVLAFGRDADRNVFQHLVNHSADFRGAVARLRPEMQGMYLAAYQSMIWNRMLDACVKSQCDSNTFTFLNLKSGMLAIPIQLPAEVRTKLLELMIPLPSARLPLDPDAIWAPWIEAALGDQGHSLSEMKLPGLRKPFFSKGERPAFVQPADLSIIHEDDERHLQRRKLVMKFSLPRGSYATILVKLLTQLNPADNMSPSPNG